MVTLTCGKQYAAYREFVATQHAVLVFWLMMPAPYKVAIEEFSAVVDTMTPYLTKAYFDGIFESLSPFAGWEKCRDAFLATYNPVLYEVEIEGVEIAVYSAVFAPVGAYYSWTQDNGTLFLDCPPPNVPPWRQ